MSDGGNGGFIMVEVADLHRLAGRDLGRTRWQEISQARVDAFAEATDDRQWIHVDPSRAEVSFFGTTVAHGYLTLSLAPSLLDQLVKVREATVINYGVNRVRFPAPVPVGSRVRMGASVEDVEATPGGSDVVYRLTFEVEKQPKPACVAEIVFRYLQ